MFRIFKILAVSNLIAQAGMAIPLDRLKLQCELNPLKESVLGSSFYEEPVLFEQRKITNIIVYLDRNYNSYPATLEKVVVIYERRLPKSLQNEKLSFELNANTRMDKRVDLQFPPDWSDGREMRFSWDPNPKISWNENGTFTAVIPGWVLFVEAFDPYHNESFEESLICSQK